MAGRVNPSSHLLYKPATTLTTLRSLVDIDKPQTKEPFALCFVDRSVNPLLLVPFAHCKADFLPKLG